MLRHCRVPLITLFGLAITLPTVGRAAPPAVPVIKAPPGFTHPATKRKAVGLNWPATLLRVESWSIPKGVSPHDIEAVIYGSPSIGFFAMAKPIFTGTKIQTEIFPPTYKSAIEYSIRLKNGKTLALGKIPYASPFSSVFTPALSKLEGRFSEPFFITSWTPEGEARPMPVVINRLGEFVWAASLTVDTWPIFSAMAQKSAAGTYAIVSQGMGSGIKILNAKTGAIEREFSQSTSMFHHMFQYDSEKEEVLTLEYECRKVGFFEENLPLFKGPLNWINYLELPRRTYMGSRAVKIDLHTGNRTKIWDTWTSSEFSSQANLSLGFYGDKYRGVRNRFRYKVQLKKMMFDKSFGFSCHSDWSHENSVRHYEDQGYLISQRNFNRVLMISADGKLKWSVGNQKDDTYSIPETENFLGHQHDAQLLADGRMLVFDNQIRFRGYSGGKRPNTIKIFKLEDGQAKLDWVMNLPPPSAEYRGSVDPIGDGRLFVYQSPGGENPNRVMELKMADKSIQGLMELKATGEKRTVEARPLDSIADEIYLRPATLGNAPIELSKLKLPSTPQPEFANEGY